MLGINRTDKMTQNFGRVLLTNIKDTIVKGLSKVPVFTEEEYMVELNRREKTSSGLCELVGLSEYQPSLLALSLPSAIPLHILS